MNHSKFENFALWLQGLLLFFACLGLVVPVVLAVDCQPAPTNMISWWPGDGNANDIYSTNNGTLQGGATATNAGLVGQCFSFDGTNGYVQIPDSPVLRPTNLTVEAWVKFSSLNSAASNPGHQYIVFKQNSRGNQYNFEGFGLGKDRYPNVTNRAGDVLYFNVSSAAGVIYEVDSSVIVQTGVWYHVAGVRGTNFIQLYVNGALQGQTSVSTPQDYGNYPLYFGTTGQPAFFDGKLAGQLDEVSIYNRALSASEITAIYNAGASGKCKGSYPPVITNQPASISVIVSNTASFTVGVTGDPTLSYQWYFNVTNTVGSNTNVLILSSVTASNTGSYSVIITNASGSATSTPALLIVKYPPTITNQPASAAVIVSSNAVFSVGAGGDAPLGYQWYFNATNAVGSNTNVFVVNNVQGTNSGGYSVMVANVSGSVTSAVAVLTVNFPPVITNQPAGLAVKVNSNAVFNVRATGDVPLAYHWFFNGTNAIGLNTNVLVLTNVQGTNAGGYSVVITNSFGSVTSSPALLAVQYPPVITNEPASISVIVSNTASFTAGVSGDSPLIYQWYFNVTNAVGLNTNTLELSNVTGTDAGNYSVIITNGSGSVTSTPALLTVKYPPVVTNEPVDLVVIVSNTATFTVGASGDSPLSYQWYFNVTNVVGLNTNVLVLNSVTAADAGSYSVIITNASGSATSTPALLTVAYPPVITNEPVDLVVIVSNTASFIVGVTGDAPLAYQWYCNGTNAVGINTNVLTLNTVLAADAGNYSVVVTNESGSATSAPAVLTVYVPPTITQQPQSVTNLAGTTAGFTALATGNPAPSYQWQFDSTNILGATASTLTLTNVQPAQAGNYTVVVGNLAGVVTSSNAVLSVIVVSPVITAGADVLNNAFGLSFPTQNGLGYHLEYKDDLSTTNGWQELTNIFGDGNPATLSLPMDAPTMRYFRLLVQ